MHTRPSLPQALLFLKQHSSHSSDAADSIKEYYNLKDTGQHFLAARYVVDIVDHFNHITEAVYNG